GGAAVEDTLAGLDPYGKPILLAPPWPEVFVGDAQRRHGFADAQAEFVRIEAALERLKWETCLLPKVSVARRMALVLATLGVQ
ncbi:MAG: AAA family ATPase, partial [Pseudomonadota bacterium]